MTRVAESIKKVPLKNDILHEHIVSTYFSRTQKTHPRHRRKSKSDTLKRVRAAMIASAVFVLIVVVMTASAVFYRYYYLNLLKDKAESSAVIKIFGEGRLNKELIHRFEFRGHARGPSRLANGEIIFANPKKYGWADLSMDFKFPIDFSKRSLILSMRGLVGGERVTVVLRDSANRSYRFNNLYLASRWTTDRISFKDSARDAIDLSKITHLRLETGRVGEERIDSPVDVRIRIKNIEIAKEG